jgi:hypothetical protein
VITKTLLHAIAVVAWATLAVGIVAGALAGRKARLLEVQLASDPEQVRKIVQGDAGRVKRLERALLGDYGFLTLYWLTYLAIGIAISRREGKLYDFLGLATALAATATAALDVVENVRTRGLLALSRPSDQVRRQPVEHLRQTALAKWRASAVTLALVSALFLPGDDWIMYLGIAVLAVAAFGLGAALWGRLISVSFLVFCAVGGTIAVIFTFFTDSVLRHL